MKTLLHLKRNVIFDSKFLPIVFVFPVFSVLLRMYFRATSFMRFLLLFHSSCDCIRFWFLFCSLIWLKWLKLKNRSFLRARQLVSWDFGVSRTKRNQLDSVKTKNEFVTNHITLCTMLPLMLILINYYHYHLYVITVYCTYSSLLVFNFVIIIPCSR